MIVSENGTFFKMEVSSKRGTSLAPMVTRVKKTEELFSKKVRYETQLKDEGVLLEPSNFKQWRTKLDQLKQVVRPVNPKELFIHKSQFLMSRRRANTIDKHSSKIGIDSIQSQAQNVEEEKSLKDAADQADTALISNDAEFGETFQGAQAQSSSSSGREPLIAEGTKLGDDFDITAMSSGLKLEQPSQLETQISTSKYVSQESCLGYLYPRKIEESQFESAMVYGSRLGTDKRIILRTDSVAKSRAPTVSNLEGLLTYPKKIYDKSGALLGFDGLKYPLSKMEERLERERQLLKSASINSLSRRHSQLSGDIFSQKGEGDAEAIPPNMEVLLNTNDGSDRMSRKASQITGWEGQHGNLTSEGGVTTIVQSTRVGGATFVKSNANRKETMESELQHLATQTQVSSTQPAKRVKSHQRKRSTSKRILTKEEKLKQKYGGGKTAKASERMSTTEMSNYAPLQFGNLNVLLDTLGKTGDIHQANEEAIKASQRAKLSRMSKHAKKVAAAAKNKTQIMAEMKQGSQVGRGSRLEDKDTMYVKDQKGNILRVSRSTIFEMNSDYHRMGPKLSQEQGTISDTDANLDSLHEASRKTRLAINMQGSPLEKEKLKDSSNSQMTNILADRRVSSNDGQNQRRSIPSKMRAQQQSQEVIQGSAIAKDRNAQNNYLSQQRLPDQINAFASQNNVKGAIWFAPNADQTPMMMVTGGHLSAKQKGQKDTKKTLRKNDPHKTSNQDLHMLDPTLTMTSPQGASKPREVSETRRSHDSHNGTILGKREIENTSDTEKQTDTALNSMSRSNHQQETMHWQVLGQNQQDMVLKEAFGKTQFNEPSNLPIDVLPGTLPITAESQRGALKNKSHDGKSESGRSSLPSMLKSMQNQMVLGQTRRSSQHSTTNYKVVGRAVSPQVKTREQSIQHSVKQNNADSLEGKSSGARGIDAQKVASNFNHQNASMMPIVIQKTTIKKTELKNIKEQITHQQIVDFPPRSQIDTKGTEALVTRRFDSQGKEIGSKKQYKMMQLDDDGYSVQDIVTFLGDSTHSLVRINEGKSREQVGVGGDTVKLEQTTPGGTVMTVQKSFVKSVEHLQPEPSRVSKDDSIHSHYRESKPPQIQKPEKQHDVIEIQEASSPVATASLHDESRRHSILISKNSTQLDKNTMPLHLVSSKDSFEVKEVQASPAFQSLNDNTETINSNKEQSAKVEPQLFLLEAQEGENGYSASPMSALLLPKADSSSTMMTMKNLNLNPSIIVNLEQTMRNKPVIIDHKRLGFSQSRSKKSTNPSSSQGAFRQKRSTSSVQRFANRTVVSQVYMEPPQEQSQFTFSPGSMAQQRGFLPKMYQKSNFARTQKAIKMIREGPLRKRKLEEQGGQFMHLNDYAALHGILAPGEALPQNLCQEVVTDGGTYILGVTGIKEAKQFSSTAYIVNRREDTEERSPNTLRNVGQMTQQQVIIDEPQSHRDKEFQSKVDEIYPQDDKEQQEMESFLENSVRKPFTSKSSVKDSEKVLSMTNQGRASENRSTSEEAHTPKLSHKMIADRSTLKKKQSRQPFNIGGQDTQLREDQVITERVNNMTIVSHPEQLNRGNETIIEQPQVAGSVTIMRNSPSRTHDKHFFDGMGSAKSLHFSKHEVELKAGQTADGAESRQQRQVIVHKLTMATPNTAYNAQRSSIQLDDSQQIQEVTSQLGSPLADNKPLSATALELNKLPIEESKEVSVTEQTNSNYFLRKASEAIRDAKFDSKAKLALQQPKNDSQSRQNIINLWAMPALQPEKAIKSQFATQQSYQGLQNMLSQTTASKQINNAENKARLFIERQRKRTATLGAQRPSKFSYQSIRAKHPDLNAKSSSPAQPPLGGDSAEALTKDQVFRDQSALQLIDQKQQQSALQKPATVDLNGDSLYDSGLIISRAPLAQNQTKFASSFRPGIPGVQLQKITNQTQVSPARQAATYLASHYSVGSAGRSTNDQEAGAVAAPPTGQPQFQFTVGQLAHASITRVNHQVLNANPHRLVSKSPKRAHTPVRHSPAEISTVANVGSSGPEQQLMLQGSVMLSSNRMGNSDGLDQDASSKHKRDHPRGNNEMENSNSTMRAYTPTLDGWQKRIISKNKPRETRHAVQVFSKRSNQSKTIKSNNSGIMSGDVQPARKKSPNGDIQTFE